MTTADKAHPSMSRGIRAPKPGHDGPATPISGDHVLGMQTRKIARFRQRVAGRAAAREVGADEAVALP